MNHEKLLSDLVAIKSYSGEEDSVREYIGKWLQERNIDSFRQGDNLLVHLKGKDPSRAFIFNSHMDTVSAGDVPWTHGPWTPTVEGDKLIGLGASDMKGGLAASMLVLEGMAKKGRPPVDIWFTYVVREEVDGSGTQEFADWFKAEGGLPDYTDTAAIFTEGTENTEIEHGHRGNLFLQATTTGDSGHASRPHLLKRHAVREMIKFANRLRRECAKWGNEFPSDVFNPPTVGEMTSITAGDANSPNKFPSQCIATFDIRTTPEFHGVAFDRIVAIAEKLGAEVEYKYPPAPAGYTDPSEKIVKVAQSLIPNSELTVSQGSADLGFLTAEGIKAIIIGPGIKEQGHKRDEYIELPRVSEAVGLYTSIVDAWQDR